MTASKNLLQMFEDYETFCKKADEFIENYKKYYKELEEKKNGKSIEELHEV